MHLQEVRSFVLFVESQRHGHWVARRSTRTRILRSHILVSSTPDARAAENEEFAGNETMRMAVFSDGSSFLGQAAELRA